MAHELPRTLPRAATREAGTHPPVAGLKADIAGGGSYKTVFTFNGVPVTDALAYASLKSFDFREACLVHQDVLP